MKTHSGYIIKADSILTADGPAPGLALKIKDGVIDNMDNIRTFPRNIRTLDFSGCMIVPCFCDHHLHLQGSKSPLADTLISHGITGVWDGGTKDCNIATTANRLSIRKAGCAIYKKGGYGKFIGKGVESMQEAEDLIDTLKQKGADYIKVINSGVFIPVTGEISGSGFDFHELKHIVGYAGSKGLDVACHSNGEKAVHEAVEAGVSFIVHGLRISSATIDLMAEKGTAFIPTVNAFASLKKISKDSVSIKNIEDAVEQHMKALKKASDKGVRMLPGSDAGPSFIPYGTSYHEELALFKKARIPVDRVLSYAAKGWFEKGTGADFLVLEGLSVKKVFINGRCI